MLGADEAARALAAFRASCPALNARKDTSGLTQAGDWHPLCAQAAALDASYAPGFFYYDFDWVKVGDGRAFATGYYEPEIAGSRTPQPGYVPIYAVPPDLVRCTKPDGTTGRGRIDETGTCVLYYTRGEIDQGALNGKGLEIAWAKDPVELFFAEIQGSALVRFDDGTVMQIGYAGQNGRDYVAIGRLLRDRGILPPGGASMQAIKDWIRANPEQGQELMRENLSYVFFKQIPGSGPLGRARSADHAAHDGRGRSKLRAARGSDLPPRRRPQGSRRHLGGAGRRRRDQGAEPLRYLLGRRA